MINQSALTKLKKELASRLQTGCEAGATILKENTPIDTKRLWGSTRSDEVYINGSIVSCHIVAGGLSLYGINRETDIQREVNYAIFVESRTNYARSSLGEISRVIIESLK